MPMGIVLLFAELCFSWYLLRSIITRLQGKLKRPSYLPWLTTELRLYGAITSIDLAITLKKSYHCVVLIFLVFYTEKVDFKTQAYLLNQ